MNPKSVTVSIPIWLSTDGNTALFQINSSLWFVIVCYVIISLYMVQAIDITMI